MHSSRQARPQRPRLAQLAFHLQPLMAADGRTPYGYEALVRWPQADGTVLGPLDFLDALLRGDGIEAFTRHGIVRIATLLAEHPHTPPLHLNLSPAQLMLPITERLLVDLRPGIRRRLRIELTEQRILDPVGYAATVRRLAAAGVLIVLDDVVPSQLSERLPSDLPVRGVKFDRSVLGDMLLDPRGAAGLTARRLAARGLDLTAEGIEDRSVLPDLRRLGFSSFQGFGLAKPYSDLASALAAHPPVPVPADASRRHS